MNKGVMVLKEIIDATCSVHKIEMSESERYWLALKAWWKHGLNKDVIGYLSREFENELHHR